MSATGEEPLPLTKFILSPPFVREHNATGVFGALVSREAYKAAYWRAWDESGIDALLCPATPGPANRPEQIQYWGYTSQWNLLDYPGVVMPTRIFADAMIDEDYDRLDRIEVGEWQSYGQEDDIYRAECECQRELTHASRTHVSFPSNERSRTPSSVAHPKTRAIGPCSTARPSACSWLASATRSCSTRPRLSLASVCQTNRRGHVSS